MHQFIETNKYIIGRIAFGLSILLAVFLLVATFAKVKEYHYIGGGMQAGSTISVSGYGKIEKSPDTAKISFTVQQNAKTVSAAQELTSQKIAEATKSVIDSGVEEKYVTTDSYNSYPNYDYPQVSVGMMYPRNNAPVLRDYTVSQSVQISVKNLDNVENVLAALARVGVTTIDGPRFGFEDDKAISREARDKAIADAQKEADKLAASLNVRLIRVVGFSENGGGSPVPMYARAGAMMDAKAEVVPNIPTGVQTVESNVSVVYEIR